MQLIEQIRLWKYRGLHLFTLFFILWVNCNGFTFTWTVLMIALVMTLFFFCSHFIGLTWLRGLKTTRNHWSSQTPKGRDERQSGNSLQASVCSSSTTSWSSNMLVTTWYQKIRYNHVTNECVHLKFVFFFIQQCLILLILKCFMEPLKRLQVDGHLMFAEPNEIFSNLDELCYVSFDHFKCLRTVQKSQFQWKE